MPGLQHLKKKIFRTDSENDFLDTALKIFNYQYQHNPVYRHFTDSLGKNPSSIHNLSEIPFMPVEFFRNHQIITGKPTFEIVFESSSTTGVTPGKHFVKDPGLYEDSFMNSFRLFYGDPEEYIIAALLPSYTERSGSSLVYMAEHLIKKSANAYSGFYRNNNCNLFYAIERGRSEKKKILVLGVSFALLDLAEASPADLSGVIVMETGGMKGRRKEITRIELHSFLMQKFNVPSIHSEYGMTELLSQAYSSGDGIFQCPPWMKVIIRDPQDPLTLFDKPAGTGGINIIDLANLDSCSFISTGDLGKLHEDGGFEVLGRFDNSDIRGCNLLVE